MHIENEVKLDFQDVLILPKRSTLSSRADVSLERSFHMRHSKRQWKGVPLLASNMDTVGSMKMCKKLTSLGMGACLHKFYEEQDLVNFFTSLPTGEDQKAFYSMGITKNDYDKFLSVKEQSQGRLTHVCLDVANGYQESFVKFLSTLREKHPDLTIMAGNVVSGEMTEHLILAGADIVKVGIGSGSACLTRKMAGVGFPQLSAIIECADAAHGLDGLICSDGGCICPGDVAKAYAAGADFVMLGGMLAGTIECDGKIEVDFEGKKFLRFHGMSSKEAQLEHYGQMAQHRASEGKEVLIPVRGSVEEVAHEILGGVRSACSYVGARQLKHLSKCATFIKVNRQLNEVFGRH